jgi:alpha-glucosidase
MPWNAEPGGGFTPAGVRPWLPMADPSQCNVADQEGDPASVLELCRRTIAARQANEDLAVGSYQSLSSPAGTWAYARGDGAIVLLNMSSQTVSFGDVAGTVAVSTELGLEGSSVEGALALPPWGGAVVTSVS